MAKSRLVVYCERCSVAGGRGLTYRWCECRSFRQVNWSRKVTWRVTRRSQLVQPLKSCQRRYLCVRPGAFVRSIASLYLAGDGLWITVPLYGRLGLCRFMLLTVQVTDLILLRWLTNQSQCSVALYTPCRLIKFLDYYQRYKTMSMQMAHSRILVKIVLNLFIDLY